MRTQLTSGAVHNIFKGRGHEPRTPVPDAFVNIGLIRVLASAEDAVLRMAVAHMRQDGLLVEEAQSLHGGEGEVVAIRT